MVDMETRRWVVSLGRGLDEAGDYGQGQCFTEIMRRKWQTRWEGRRRGAGNGDIFFVFSFPEYMYMMDSTTLQSGQEPHRSESKVAWQACSLPQAVAGVVEYPEPSSIINPSCPKPNTVALSLVDRRAYISVYTISKGGKGWGLLADQKDINCAKIKVIKEWQGC